LSRISEEMMGNEGRIIYVVECRPDFKLVKVLGIPKKKIKHVAGKGNVCRVLKKKENSVGMVDEDPDCPTFLFEGIANGRGIAWN